MIFHIFKFHNIFKGLIGFDNLKLLNVMLDFKNNLFITPNVELKFHHQDIRKNKQKFLYHRTSI